LFISRIGNKLNTKFSCKEFISCTGGRLMLNYCVGEAIPLFFWTSAEPGISVVCTWLPAMLPLGRKLARYLSLPCGSRSIVKIRRENFSSFGGAPYETKISKDNDTPPRRQEDSSTGLRGRSSADGRRDVWMLSPINDSYHPHAYAHAVGAPSP
jgi:hypothetical protein